MDSVASSSSWTASHQLNGQLRFFILMHIFANSVGSLSSYTALTVHITRAQENILDHCILSARTRELLLSQHVLTT